MLNANSNIYQLRVPSPSLGIEEGKGEDLESPLRTANTNIYQQIRVKNIKYLEKPATAVYFQDMTSHVK